MLMMFPSSLQCGKLQSFNLGGHMEKKLSVFRDMNLRGPKARRAELRVSLIAQAKAPWFFEPEKSAEMGRYSPDAEDILVFRRAEDRSCRTAGLTLWSTPDGYYVPNIVPIESGSLTHSEYNAILDDFITTIAEPVAGQFGFVVDASTAQQGLDDWLSADVAQMLRRFSHLANKSTGASHPMDRDRWFEFVVGVHRSGADFSADKLTRWLYEVERWDENSAHDLAGEYERYLELLHFYDKH